jgi:hypothetical protein
VDDLKGDMTMPVRTDEQATAAAALGDQIQDVSMELALMLPFNMASVRHPEMLEEIHWDLTQIKWRLRLAVTGEYDAP